MRSYRGLAWVVCAILGLSLLFVFNGNAAAQAESETKEHAAECTDEELDASVPALKDLHEIVYPLWHTAYPNKDCAMIKELLPEADALTAKVDEAELPGILRDKTEEWEAALVELKASLADLHAAAEADNEEAILQQTERFHAAYEKMVRTIRPIAPELAAFHQELYKLYHYYMPAYDLPKMREAAALMMEKVPPLKEAKLPKRVADRKEAYDAAVAELEVAVAEMSKTLQTDDKEANLKAVEKAHTAYVKTEGVFD